MGQHACLLPHHRRYLITTTGPMGKNLWELSPTLVPSARFLQRTHRTRAASCYPTGREHVLQQSLLNPIGPLNV